MTYFFAETDITVNRSGLKSQLLLYHRIRVESMGQGGSRAGRLTKEDVMFLKANTRYDEDTIQVQPLTWSDQFPIDNVAGVVQGFHLGLPQRKTHSSRLCQDLQPVFPEWQCQGLLRPHLQDLRHGWKRLHWLQRIPTCYQRHIKWISWREVELGFQVKRIHQQCVSIHSHSRPSSLLWEKN